MGRRGPFRWGLALAVVLVAQQTIAGEVCRTGCRGASKSFKYAQGTTYKYNYEGKIDISISSAEGQVSTTEVKATVLLTQQADCNQLLRLQNVHITGANGKKYGTIPDLEKPISINFHDGHIEDSICTVPDDTQNSLNIKRAIASLFQANFKGSHETDVFGLCPTEFARQNEGHYLVIQKSRNLNKCAYRENIRQDFFSTVFNIHSEIKSSPLLNGEYNAKLKIKDGILEQANVVENYLYVPFSVGKNGARAQVTSKLHLTGNSHENPASTCTKPRSIIFDNPHPVTAPTSNVNSILDAVKAVVKTIDIVVGEETAKEFITLIKTVRAAKTEDLLSVYNQVKSGAGFSDKIAAKKAFLDALLQAATSDALEVAITLLKSNEFNDIEKKMVYASLSFVRHSSESLLTAAGSLLAQRNLPYQAYLGIGNIAGRYCQQHSCEKVDAVNQLTQKLIQKLGDNKAANKQEENEMVYVLKSLGNFGHLSDTVLQKLVAVAQDKQAPTRLRVVALETYLSDPCKDQLRNSALNILSDIQQDSEIRIKAYLAATQCPNAKVGNTIKNLLDKEPSYQVGGFIVSHIRSLKASANPDKNLAKKFLSFSVPKRFPIDFRKYSYNGEFSYSIDTLGLAASSESNVIYSQDSFLPRSASLNLTAEVFGHTFNFLELQTRQENLDKLVEHYFGPKGILKSSSLSNILKENSNVTHESLKYLSKKYNEVIRSRRDISKAELKNIGKAVQIKENVLNKDLDLDLSVKAFGSEVFFNNFNIYQGGLSPEAIIDNVMKGFAEGLDKLKNFQETLRTNLLLLDVELDYPTGLGFPLRLAAEGTANVQIQTEGNIDVRQLLKTLACETKIKLIPSASVEVTGRLTLDAYVVESGLKIINTLHSATGIDLSVGITRNQEFDIKLGLPLPEQKIISVNHDIVLHTREQAGHEVNAPLKFAQQKDFSICIDQLSPFIGLAFCGEINGPDLVGKQTPVLPFPLSGFAKFAVSIENEDVSYYQLKGFLHKNEMAAEVVFAVFGKNHDKKSELRFNLQVTPEHYVKLVLTSPLKTAYAEARLTNTANEKSALAKFGYDQEEFYGKIGILISGPANNVVYKPIFEFKVPEGIQGLPVKVEGQVIAEESANGRKYTLDNVKLFLPNGQDISVNGNFGAESEAFFTDLTFSNAQSSATFKGRLVHQQKLLKFNSEFTNTINSAFNFDVKSEVKTTDEDRSLDFSFQLIHGPDLSSKTNKLSLAYKSQYSWNGPGDYGYSEEAELSYPLLGINTEYEIKFSPKVIGIDVDFQYNDIKLGTELDIAFNKEHSGDFEFEYSIYGLDNKVKVKLERKVKGDTSIIDNELEVNGKKLEVEGTVKHVFKSGSVDIGADLTVTIPNYSTPFKVNSGLKYNPNDYDIHHKVTSGSTVIIDAFIKGNKQGNANGSFKVNIKNYLVANGQVKATKGAGTAELLIDAQRVKQQIKIESNFKIQPTTIYNIDLTIYPSYDKDKAQQIKISTHNKVNPTSLESKSSLDILGKKMEFNLQGKKTGNEQTGNLNGEVELTLPNDIYLLGKINSNREHKNDLFNGDEIVSLEYRKNKNTSGKKLSVKAVYKNTNAVQGLYDVAYTVSADDSNGGNINGDLNYKRQKEGERAVVELGNKIYGSLIRNAISGTLKAAYDKQKGEIDINSSYGTDTNIKLGGSYGSEGEGKPCAGKVYMELTSPNKVLKSLNVEFSGSVLRPTKSSDLFEIKGSANIFADDDGSIPEPIIDMKAEGSVRASDKEGSIQGKVNYAKQGPISALANYHLKENGKEKQATGNAELSYGHDKNFKVSGTFVGADENQVKIDAEIETPFENYRSTKLNLQSKRSADQKHVTAKLTLTSDGKQFSLDSEVQLSDISPLVNLKCKTFDGKSSQIYFKANTVSQKEFSGELKLTCEATDFLFEGDINANFDNVQNFFVKANVNSPYLKINKIFFEAQNKPGKGDRKIQITVKQADKNIISGTTSYQTRDEQGKFVAEGSGSFKVKGESRSGNFKFVNQRLSGGKNGEQGLDVSLDVNIGKTTFDSEFKLTDKQFKVLNSYCQKPKECSRIEINSNVKNSDVKLFDQDFEIIIDLRKLGVPQDFELKAKTQRKESTLDHHVGIQFNNGATKYEYDVYVHPTKAGISLTTPKRLISLEANANIPKDIKNGGKFSGDISFYLDKKNAPSKKASVEGWLNVDVSSQYKVTGEAKLNHPGLSRTLSITLNSVSDTANPQKQLTVRAEFDVFAQPAQKIVAIYTATGTISSDGYNSDTKLDVKSSGLGVNIGYHQNSKFDRTTYSGEFNSKMKYLVGNSNYDSGLSISGNKEQFNFLLNILNKDLLKSSSKFSCSKDQQVIDSEFSSYDNKPIVTHLEIKNFNTLLFTIGYKNNNDKLQISAGLIPSQIADVRGDRVKGSGKINLFHATVHLEETNFLKPDFYVSSKDIEEIVRDSERESNIYFEGLKKLGKDWIDINSRELRSLSELSKHLPNPDPIRQYYTSEMDKIKGEFLEDKSIKEVLEVLNKTFGAAMKSFAEIVDIVTQNFNALVHSLQVTISGIVETIDKDIIPPIKELADKLTGVIAEITRSALEIASAYLATISQLIEKYQPQFKEIGAIFGEIGQDIARFIQNAYLQTVEILLNLGDKFYNEIKALPIFEELKAQYEEFTKDIMPTIDGVIGGLREISATIKDLIPPEFLAKPEIVEIIDLTIDYIEKKVKQQPVNDFGIIEKIIANQLAIFRKVLAILSAPSYEVPRGDIPFTLDFLKKLPKLVAIKFSPIAYILKEDPTDAIVSFVASLIDHPRRWLPPFPLYAILVQGQFIFTFDGKLINFPANCKYLFARDAVNGNFTLAGTYNNGYLNSITLADHHDTITIKKGGQVLLNNAATELPARKPEISAFRNYEMITIVSTSGITVSCLPDLEGCSIHISGFYHGQVRGLLGNGNNEPYDDFTIPNGQIVTKEEDFGNAYKIGNCQPVTIPKHDKKQENEACNELFGYESSLRLCYPFVSNQNFKAACVQGLASKVKNIELLTAKAYVAACWERNIPIQVPSNLLKCTNSDKTYSIGDTFSVKVPGKAADIVLIVDTLKENEAIYKDLIQPAVVEVVKLLQAKGVSDVQFHMIAYDGENQWPSHITVGGKLTFKGKAPNIKFSAAPKEAHDAENDRLYLLYKGYVSLFEDILYDLKLAVGQDLRALTFTEAYYYPFRANALKSIIVANSKPCEVGRFFLLQKLRTLLFQNNQISLNLITPLEKLSVKNNKKTKDIIGFNDNQVFTISQAKTKPEGNAELYKDLDYNDFCVDFTIKNRGNVFGTNNFASSKPDVKKQFVHVAAHNIVTELLNTEQGLNCECKQVSPYTGYNVCEEAYAKEK